MRDRFIEEMRKTVTDAAAALEKVAVWTREPFDGCHTLYKADSGGWHFNVFSVNDAVEGVATRGGTILHLPPDMAQRALALALGHFYKIHA